MVSVEPYLSWELLQKLEPESNTESMKVTKTHVEWRKSNKAKGKPPVWQELPSDKVMVTGWAYGADPSLSWDFVPANAYPQVPLKLEDAFSQHVVRASMANIHSQ